MNRVASWLGTWFGSGYSPWAPGTVGSIAALPLYLLIRDRSLEVYGLITAAVIGLGIWSAGLVAKEAASSDPSFVVIDEVAGVLLALGLVRGSGVGFEVAAWLLFRLLDILKPWPIHRLEQARPEGLGILLDDVAAGLLAGAAVQFAERFSSGRI